MRSGHGDGIACLVSPSSTLYQVRNASRGSADMMADGLTKALAQEQFVSFREQIGLVDISERLAERRETEDRRQAVRKAVEAEMTSLALAIN